MPDFQFTCATCGEVHTGIPTFGFKFPIQYLQVPEAERETRISLGSDDCVIDEKGFFVRGLIEIPVHGYDDAFIWGAWVSLSEANYLKFVEYFDEDKRSHI